MAFDLQPIIKGKAETGTMKDAAFCLAFPELVQLAFYIAQGHLPMGGPTPTNHQSHSHAYRQPDGANWPKLTSMSTKSTQFRV